MRSQTSSAKIGDLNEKDPKEQQLTLLFRGFGNHKTNGTF